MKITTAKVAKTAAQVVRRLITRRDATILTLSILAFVLLAASDAAPAPNFGDELRMVRRFELADLARPVVRSRLSGYRPVAMRYDKRHFDSLAGQSLGKRSGGGASISSDIFRPYAFYSLSPFDVNTDE